MLANIIHVVLACLLAYAIYYAVYQKKPDDNSNDGGFDDIGHIHDIDNIDDIDEIKRILENLTVTSPDEIFEENIELSHVTPEEELLYSLIDGRYLVGEIMAVGHIGIIRNGLDQYTETDVVIKFVPPGLTTDLLENEYQKYLLLGADDPNIIKHGIPHVKFFGNHGGYKVLVMQMLGPTLYEIKEFSKQHKFSGKTILKVAIQLMDILSYAHSKGLCIYDFDSSNIAIGNSKENMNQVFVFDLAMSVDISEECRAEDDLRLLGLILLELNGVHFPSRNELDTDAKPTLDEVIESQLMEWDDDYVKELCTNSDHQDIFLKFFEMLANLKPNQYDELTKLFSDGLTLEEFQKDNLGIFESL